MSLFSQTKTGTLKIFSELDGVTVYLDENKQTANIREIPDIPIGTHYLKVLLGTASVYSEMVEIKEGVVTSILIKNTGQVAEKIMESKVKEIEEYNNKKIDILFSSNSVSQTQSRSTLFPGYYGYWGASNSITSTTQISDFKIIQGGVKEISDLSFARLVDNQQIINQYAADVSSDKKSSRTMTIIGLVGVVALAPFIIDACAKEPFMPGHEIGSGLPNWEWGAIIGTGAIAVIGLGASTSTATQVQDHYYSVDGAAKEAQDYNRKLKEKLGLPESYDMNK